MRLAREVQHACELPFGESQRPEGDVMFLGDLLCWAGSARPCR